jgi:hypothetical protein
MLSPQHEHISMLFRTPSILLVKSISESPRVMRPSYHEMHTDSADLTDVQPGTLRVPRVSFGGDTVSDEPREEIEKMNTNVEEPVDDWALVWVNIGKKKARAEIIRKQLGARFGTISPEIESRIRASSADELDSMALRILTATTMDQVVVER